MGCNTQLESSRCHQTQCISGFLIATSAFSTVLLCILNWHHACNPRFPQLSEVEKTCNRLRRIEVVMHRMFFRYLNIPACRGHHAASACSWSWLSAVSASGASKSPSLATPFLQQLLAQHVRVNFSSLWTDDSVLACSSWEHPEENAHSSWDVLVRQSTKWDCDGID